jgi:hypothetical protein
MINKTLTSDSQLLLGQGFSLFGGNAHFEGIHEVHARLFLSIVVFNALVPHKTNRFALAARLVAGFLWLVCRFHYFFKFNLNITKDGWSRNKTV